jgi:RNA polymerase sigma-70 factor (ECF subfamily)
MTLPDQAPAMKTVELGEPLPDPRIVAIQSECETPEAQVLREQAWASIYDEHAMPLTRYARRIFEGDHYAAEDLVQEAFESAFRKINAFENRGPDPLGHWLTRITRNAAIDRLRRKKAVAVSSEIMEEVGQPLHSPYAEPFDRVAFQETLEELNESLPATNRSALLASAAGLTIEENASRHGVTVPTITGRVFRGRRAARKIIERAA